MAKENIPMAYEQQAELMQISSAESLEALNRSEIDVQISTAKKYPRNIQVALKNIEEIATMDEDIAASCFYILNRDGKKIEGASVRMAEIIASSWGNIRVQARIIGNDGRVITAQGICHDLETNYAVSSEVKRRITNKYGKTYSEDMQVVTGNAACAIALRNALFKVIPYALIKGVIEKAKKCSIGDSLKIETSRSNMLAYFQKIGVDEQHIFDYLSVSKIEEINGDMIVELRGLANAIKEGTTTIEETFFNKQKENKEAEKNPSADIIAASMQKQSKASKNKEEAQQEPAQETTAVDQATGELFNEQQ